MDIESNNSSIPSAKPKKKHDKKHHAGVKHRHKKKPRVDGSGNIIDVSGEIMQDLSLNLVGDLSMNPVGDLSSNLVEDISSNPVEDLSLNPLKDISLNPVEDLSLNPLKENISIVYETPKEVAYIHEIYSDKEDSDPETVETVENTMPKTNKTKKSPKLVFIVPYRDREHQLIFFREHMVKIMEDYDKSTYQIIYLHQKDARSFNRGAMKNIGFLYVKTKYPDDYKSMTLVFNDVDTMPLTKNFLNYETHSGNVKHFYGYEFTLGGIVSITGNDFEKIGGYANYWAWGFEDNVLQDRVLKAGLKIDRSNYYPIMDKNILQLKDGITRLVNRGEFDKYEQEKTTNKTVDGFHTIKDLQYVFDEISGFVNVTSFTTQTPENIAQTTVHDMRNGAVPFKRARKRPKMGMFMHHR